MPRRSARSIAQSVAMTKYWARKRSNGEKAKTTPYRVSIKLDKVTIAKLQKALAR